MKCPYCGEEIKYTGIEGCKSCENPQCIMYHYEDLDMRIWKDIIAGKRAQDALKVSISALGLVGNGKADKQGILRFVDQSHAESVRDICRKALSKIKSITKQECK